MPWVFLRRRGIIQNSNIFIAGIVMPPLHDRGWMEGHNSIAVIIVTRVIGLLSGMAQGT